MGKLHELIAVEPDLKQKAVALLSNVGALFQRGGSFLGQTRKYTPKADDGQQLPPENKEVETTVTAQLERLRLDVGNWIDASVQKEITNTKALTTLTLSGESFSLPATALLNLEGKLSQLRAVYAAIPTNDTSEKWTFNANEGFWLSDPTETIRTTKKAEPLVKYHATKEHPAQVELVGVDVPEGRWVTHKRSGMFSPVDKQARLDRLDSLLLEVKKARQRANDVDADTTKIAESLFRYIDGK